MWSVSPVRFIVVCSHRELDFNRPSASGGASSVYYTTLFAVTAVVVQQAPSEGSSVSSLSGKTSPSVLPDREVKSSHSRRSTLRRPRLASPGQEHSRSLFKVN